MTALSFSGSLSPGASTTMRVAPCWVMIGSLCAERVDTLTDDLEGTCHRVSGGGVGGLGDEVDHDPLGGWRSGP